MALVENDGTLPLAPDLAPDRRHRADRRQRPRPARRLRPPAPHRDARGAAPPGQPVRLPIQRGHQPVDELSRHADDPRRAPRARFGARVVATRAAAVSGTARTRSWPRPSRSRTAPTSRSLSLGERSGLTDDATTGEFARPPRPRPPRTPAGAARGGRRDRHADRARGRQRPAARDRVGRRALRGGAPRVGARRGRPGGDRRHPRRRRRPGRQAAGHDPAPRRPGAADLPPPPDRRAVQPEGRLRRRAVVAALAVRPRPVVHDLRDRAPAGRPTSCSRPAATRWRSRST